MIKAFLDTDVILDLLVKREPFATDARAIFQALESGLARGFVCALSFPNLHYFLRKSLGEIGTIRVLEKLRAMVSVLTVDDKVIARALASEFNDFEDAVQYYSAVQGGANFIVTRNLKDYKKSEITVCSPADFMGMLRK